MELSLNPRWRAGLEGEAGEIAELERLLNSVATDAYSTFVWRIDASTAAITTHAWDHVDTPTEASELAESSLKLFVGAMRLHSAGNPLTIGTMYEVTESGELRLTRDTKFRMFVKPAHPQSPADFCRALALARDRDWLASALIELSTDIDWYVIFRIIENIERFCGGGERDMLRVQTRSEPECHGGSEAYS
ncbi:hypothetical protein [Croceibacterium ferulae]|uniref:hypothetical protein n=1 Tax=Croceibacterium ferulae TaxID=1854641 RepID=UPI000F860140|nr:hypothetical protein [Croceibacterium ferulae]